MQVIITRTGDDARTTARLVADLGCIPVIAPLARRLALPVAIPDRHFDGLIITSRASVAMLDRTQLEPLLQVPVFCVGDATADLARRTGFETVFSAAGDVTGLISLIHEQVSQDQALLYLTGEPHKTDIELALSGTMRLTTLATYRMEAAEAFPQEALALLDDPHPVWLHYSQQSVERAVALAKASPRPDLFPRARHLLISQALQAAVKAAGGTDITIATQPNQQAMMGALLTMRKALRM